MPADSMEDVAQKLLSEREARGLWGPLVARVGFLGLGLATIAVDLVGEASTGTSSSLTPTVLGVLIVAIALNLALLQRLYVNRSLATVGVVGAAFDVLLLYTFLGLAIWAGAEDRLSVAFVFKTELPATYVFIIVINGLALRPRYPIVVGSAATLALAAVALWVILSPSIVLTTDRHAVFAGDAHDPEQLVMIVILMAAVTAATSYAAHIARATVRVGIAREVEMAKLREDHLRIVMREKITSLGRLVAGVCHEINNPLGVLRSSVDTQRRIMTKLRSTSTDDAKTLKLLDVGQTNLDGMIAAAQRIERLEISLRGLSHLDEAVLQPVDLRVEVRRVVETIARERGISPEIEWHLHDLPVLQLNAAEIGLALVAVVERAFAMSQARSALVIRAETRDDEVQLDVEIPDALPSPELTAVFDVGFDHTGSRVTAELSLATAQAALHRRGGSITVDHPSGGGVRFAVRLPLDARPEPYNTP